MPIPITKVALTLRVPASIRFADMGVQFDIGSKSISFNKAVMRRVLEASGMDEASAEALPAEITDAFIALWYQHAVQLGEPTDPDMDRFLFHLHTLQDEPAAHTVH